MDEIPWFEYEEGDLDVAQRAFVGVLADRAGYCAAGCPAELGNKAAEWFEAVLARPLVRWEWHHKGRMYAVRYEYADTERGLSQGFEDSLAPDVLRQRLAADGVIRGRGRINRAGLGQPDVIAHVRGVRPDQ